MNNLKTNIDDLYVGKLKTDPVDLEKLSDVADNVVKKKNQHTKDKKISDGAALIHTNQCNR